MARDNFIPAVVKLAMGAVLVSTGQYNNGEPIVNE
jgi:hypothetical protein